MESLVDKEQLEKNKSSLTEAVYKVACVANYHLQQARELILTVPKAAIPALLVSVPLDRFLTTLQRCDFDIYHPDIHSLNRSEFSLYLKLYKHYLLKKY